MNSDNIDFVTYCIGNLSRRLGLNARDVYHRLKTSGILADLIFYTDNPLWGTATLGRIRGLLQCYNNSIFYHKTCLYNSIFCHKTPLYNSIF